MSDHVQCPRCIGTGMTACGECSGWGVGGCTQCGGSNAVSCARCAGARRIAAAVALRPNFVERHGGRFFAAGTLLAATATALVLGSHIHI